MACRCSIGDLKLKLSLSSQQRHEANVNFSRGAQYVIVAFPDEMTLRCTKISTVTLECLIS